MDSLTLASTLATLAQLLRVFKDERQDQKNAEAATIDEYLEWLRRNDHQQLVDLVNENLELSQSLEEIMQGHHEVLMAKLTEIGSAIGEVSSQVASLVPQSGGHNSGELSRQAVSILQQIVASNATKLLETKFLAYGVRYELKDESRRHLGLVNLTEPEFADDDLEKLCDLRFLSVTYDKNLGWRTFKLTRDGLAVGGSNKPPAADTFTEFLPGLNSTELFCLAKAVIGEAQTIQCGRGDTTAATLESKGLLVKVPFEPPYKNAQIPYTVATHVWKYLNENKTWLIERAIETNQDRPDDRLPLLNEALEKLR